MPGVGQQFDFDRFPQALRGGMRVYPYGGVLSGLLIGTCTLATGTLSIPYSAGVVRLDGTQISVALNDGTGYQRTGLVANTTYEYELFVKPTYANTVVTSAVANNAAAPSGSQGNIRLHCVDMGSYFQIVNFYRYTLAGGWAIHDPIFDQPSLDYGNLPHNSIVGATLGFEPDKMVYNKTASVPFISQPAAHYARYDASFRLGTLRVVVGANASTLTSAVVTYDEIYLPA